MDEPQIDDLCPKCGSPTDGPTHECADPATPRITIPPGLLDTGLFKTVGVRPPTGPSVSGSLLRRIDDQSETVEATEVEAPEVEAPEVEAEPAEVEAPEEVEPAEESSEVAEQPSIDNSLVVPAFLIAEQPADNPEPEEPAAEDHPGDPEAARAALMAILYPDLNTAAADTDAATDAPEPPKTPGIFGPDTPATPFSPAGRVSLASLRHQAEDDYEEDDEDDKPRPRLALVGIGALVILIVAAGGGWAWCQHQQDAPVRNAFATSHGGFLTAVQELTEATTLADVADVGTAFGELSDDFEKTTAAADGSTSDVAVAARRATLAEREVATAGAYLADLSPDNFSPWLEARDSLTSALEGLDSVRADVAKAGGKSSDLPDADLAEQVAGLIGSQASDLAVDKTDLMLADLGKAKLVADVRAVGTDAAGSADALRTVAAGVDAGDDADPLVQHTELHAQLGKLANLRPNNLSRWEGIRDRLIDRVEFLPDEGAEAKESIANADQMLAEASDTWEAWQRETAQATAAQEAEEEVLDAIESTLKRVSTDHDALNSSLGALITRGDTLESNGLEGDAYERLSGAADARTRLRNSITALDAPGSVSADLNAVTVALEASASSVRAAADSAAQCADECVLTDTSGWNDMVRARIGQATRFTAAADAMVPALAAAREAITERELPKRPKI